MVIAAYTECFENDLIFVKKSTIKWFQLSSFAKRGFYFNRGGSIFHKFIKSDRTSISVGMFNYQTN